MNKVDYLQACSPSPCKNGFCYLYKDSFACNCTEGYIGKECDKKLSDIPMIIRDYGKKLK